MINIWGDVIDNDFRIVGHSSEDTVDVGDLYSVQVEKLYRHDVFCCHHTMM